MSKAQEHITAYLNGEMTTEEMLDFEREVSKDPKLAASLRLEKDMQIAFGDDDWFLDEVETYDPGLIEKYTSFFTSKEAKDLEHKITGVIAKNRPKQEKPKLWYAVAAACIVGMMLTYFLWPQEQVDYQELYADVIAINSLPSLISRNTNDPLLVKGQTAFEAKDYKKAVDFFSGYQETGQKELFYGEVYLGIAYLELDKFDRAIETFRNLETSESLDSGLAKWYRALAYLKKEDTKELKKILNEIISVKGTNYQKAQDLLKQLD